VIEAIFFDLGNVIIPFNVDLAYARMAELCVCSKDEVAARIRATGLARPSHSFANFPPLSA